LSRSLIYGTMIDYNLKPLQQLVVGMIIWQSHVVVTGLNKRYLSLNLA
jgi:hypothetical protein